MTGRVDQRRGSPRSARRSGRLERCRSSATIHRYSTNMLGGVSRKVAHRGTVWNHRGACSSFPVSAIQAVGQLHIALACHVFVRRVGRDFCRREPLRYVVDIEHRDEIARVWNHKNTVELCQLRNKTHAFTGGEHQQDGTALWNIMLWYIPLCLPPRRYGE